MKCWLDSVKLVGSPELYVNCFALWHCLCLAVCSVYAFRHVILTPEVWLSSLALFLLRGEPSALKTDVCQQYRQREHSLQDPIFYHDFHNTAVCMCVCVCHTCVVFIGCEMLPKIRVNTIAGEFSKIQIKVIIIVFDSTVK